MRGSGTTERHRFPGTGTVQGTLQAMAAAALAWTGSRFYAYFSMSDRDAPPILWILIAAIVGLLIGLGVSVDVRRTRAPLSLTGPAAARMTALAIVLLAMLAGAWGSSMPTWASLAGGALVFLVLDRIVGPAWVLAIALWQSWSRRGWRRHDVVEVEGGRALLRDPSSGAALRARSELPLELGAAYVELELLPSRAEPYRHDEVSARVRALETLEARATRAHTLGTAALALLSGLLWLALPYCTTLGRELTRAR
jgi:hypothetical protein